LSGSAPPARADFGSSGGGIVLTCGGVLAGTGGLDHAALFSSLRDLGPDLPVMLEHLPTPAEYTKAAAYVRAAALKEGVEFIGPS
jgi:sugar phosphate isomerase/epimerase